MAESDKTIRYKMCKHCLEALRLAQTIEYIHPSSPLVAAALAEKAGKYVYPELDPVRRN